MSDKLSVIVPVYNEKDTILKVLDIIHDVPVEKEIVVVDDGSKDGTTELLTGRFSGKDDFKVSFHEKNLGKGSAIRTGICRATGGMIIIQDADLEYNPFDYLPLIEKMRRTGAAAVYGSRFLGKKRVTSGWHRGVNGFLTWLTNLLYGASLSDMETCYKLFRADFLKSLDLRSTNFEIEVELTAKTLKAGQKIIEIPIAYKGRAFHEGKKIGWKDGVEALFRIFYYRFFEK